MYLSDFDFSFRYVPYRASSVEPRDVARLLVLGRTRDEFIHRRVKDLVDLLSPGDLLVVNDTKVLPVRLLGKKQRTGGQIEILLIREIKEEIWEVLVRGRVRPGQVLDLEGGAKATIQSHHGNRTILSIAASCPVRDLIQQIGWIPLPPYIKRLPEAGDRTWYQTVFAKHEGAIAAPTAGLHFTPALLHALQQRGIHMTSLTLHVGPGTFLPVKTEDIRQHRMYAEDLAISQDTVEKIAKTKQQGGRVIAVGTTVVRGLESSVDEQGRVQPCIGETDVFITPGYTFRVVDGLLTNFHMPRSTLLMLVSAFAGHEKLRSAYAEALKERYRLYSYGDAMLIL